jgi:O-acetylserine/cysteine efflux transporter
MENNTVRPSLSLRAIVVLILVAAIWGFNFVVIKVGVDGVPPFFLAALRFTLCVFPAIFIVRRPPVSWALLASYGLLIGLGEFGFLFLAIKLGAPSGLSSIILQSQAFFTVILAAFALRERIRACSVAGMAVAALGLALIARSSLVDAASGLALVPLAMVIVAAFCWAAANIVAQRMPKADGLSLMIWSSAFSPLPLFALSFAFERSAVVSSLAAIRPITIGALAYLVVLSTLFGYGAWNQLIMRHGAKKIAPFSLLIPVFGVVSSAVVFHERFTRVDALAACAVLVGLAIHSLGPILLARFAPRASR